METCRAEGRQQSLGKWYNRSLGHFRGKTMDPIVMSPLTSGTFSSNPQINHVDNVSFHSGPRVKFMGLFKFCLFFTLINSGRCIPQYSKCAVFMDSISWSL